MSSLVDAIKSKLKSDDISATAAARSVGLSLPSFRAVLKGKSSPNARSVKKYAKLLSISDDEVRSMAGIGAEKPAAKSAAKRRGRPPGRKPGPKPGRGRKPGRPRGRPPGRPARAAGGFAPIVAMLEQAEALMGDDLAVAVHELGKGQRATIAAIIQSLA